MSNPQSVDSVKEAINKLDREGLVLVLLNKESNIFGEVSLKEKCGKMSEEQLREEIVKSFERGYDAFDITFVCMLPGFSTFSRQDNSAAQEFIDEVMEHFEFCNEKYEDKKRRRNIIELVTNNTFRLDVKDYISELLMNDDELDESNHDEQVEHIFLYLIYELLYVTTSNVDFASLVAYWSDKHE